MRRTRTKKVKRQRTRKKSRRVRCSNHRCWYDGDCPHKKFHDHSPDCEQEFCSKMGITTGCVERREEVD